MARPTPRALSCTGRSTPAKRRIMAGPIAETRQGLTEDAWAAAYTEGGRTRIDQALLAHAPA